MAVELKICHYMDELEMEMDMDGERRTGYMLSLVWFGRMAGFEERLRFVEDEVI